VTIPFTFLDPGEEVSEFEVKSSRGKANIHRSEHFHSRSRQASCLSQQRNKKKLPVGTATTIAQQIQDVEVEPHSLSSDEIGPLIFRALAFFRVACLGQSEHGSLRFAFPVGDDEPLKQQPTRHA
jgi:hypothetical protein